MTRVAVGLYTLRTVDEPLARAIERVGEAGYDGVEFAFRVEDADPASVADALSGSEMAVTGAHVGPDFGERFDGHVARYRALGCPALVLSRLEDRYFESSERVGDAVTALNDCARRVEGAGFDFLYHNHRQELRQFDDRPAFDRLVEGTEDVGFVLDVGWAAAAGADPAAVIERHGDRIPQIHFADVDESGRQVQLGEGILDVSAVARAAREAGVEWFVYEHDAPDDPLDTVAEVAPELRRLSSG
jgi:sugar phosphate isomerase/epimerase